jgi:glutathione S-transferase
VDSLAADCDDGADAKRWMEARMTLTLYIGPGSSSMAPHIALNEAGADFDLVSLSFKQRAQKEPGYLALNPEGKVPTLLVDGRAMTEVAGILYFIARAYPQAGLLPPQDDIEGQAQVIALMSFCAATIHPAAMRGTESLQAAFAHAERRLAGRTWIHGEAMTIADIHLFRLFWRNRTRAALTADLFPELTAHHDRMMARPAVIRTVATESAIGYELPA